jgi:hypothetical protein
MPFREPAREHNNPARFYNARARYHNEYSSGRIISCITGNLRRASRNLTSKGRQSVFRKNRLHPTSRRRRRAPIVPSLCALILLAHALAFSAFAQTDPPDQPDAPSAPPVQNVVPRPQAGTSNDHMFDLIPNFLTLENAGKVPPLTTGGKFKTVARGAFDWGEFVWAAGVSGLGQLENSEPEYHQGLEGYGKRYATNFADGAIENFVTSAILPSILKQDPRFYQSSQGSFLHRLGYAASRILITRGDSGSTQFNFSEVFGSAMAAGISTYSYHPHAERTVANTASVWGTQVGYDTLSFVFKEFWPDIRKNVFHQKQPAPPSQ